MFYSLSSKLFNYKYIYSCLYASIYLFNLLSFQIFVSSFIYLYFLSTYPSFLIYPLFISSSLIVAVLEPATMSEEEIKTKVAKTL